MLRILIFLTVSSLFFAACGKKNSPPRRVNPAPQAGEPQTTPKEEVVGQDAGENNQETPMAGATEENNNEDDKEGKKSPRPSTDLIQFLKDGHKGEATEEDDFGPRKSGKYYGSPNVTFKEDNFYMAFRDKDGRLGSYEISAIDRLYSTTLLSPQSLKDRGSLMVQFNHEGKIYRSFYTDKHRSEIGLSMRSLWNINQKGLCDITLTYGCAVTEGSEVYLVGRIPTGRGASAKIIGFPLSAVKETGGIIINLLRAKAACEYADSIVYFERPNFGAPERIASDLDPTKTTCSFEGKIDSQKTRFLLTHEKGFGSGVIRCQDKSGVITQTEVDIELTGWGLGLSLGLEAKKVECPEGATSDVCYEFPKPRLTQYQRLNLNAQGIQPANGLQDLLGKFVFLDGGFDACTYSAELSTIPTVYIGRRNHQNDSIDWHNSDYEDPIQNENTFPVEVQIQSTDNLCFFGVGLGGASLNIIKK